MRIKGFRPSIVIGILIILALGAMIDNDLWGKIKDATADKEKAVYSKEEIASPLLNSLGTAYEKDFHVVDGTLVEYEGNKQSVKLPYGITAIGERAFLRSDAAYVTLPDTITHIGSNAFALSHLAVIYLPEGLQYIGPGAFSGTPYFDKIKDRDDEFVLFYDNLIAYNGKEAEVVVPDGVTVIDDNAFANNTAVAQVILPQSITTIGSNAFSGCTNLRELTLPNTVLSVANDAFSGTPWIEKQKQGDYTIVGDGILLKYHGTGANRLTLPDTIKTLSSFSIDDPAIRELILPESVTTIEDQGFTGCANLSSVTIPESVRFIDPHEYRKHIAFGEAEANHYTILCKEGSYAHDFAVKYSFQTVFI